MRKFNNSLSFSEVLSLFLSFKNVSITFLLVSQLCFNVAAGQKERSTVGAHWTTSVSVVFKVKRLVAEAEQLFRVGSDTLVEEVTFLHSRRRAAALINALIDRNVKICLL